MICRAAADLVVICHLLFIAFVMTGGFLVLLHRAWSIVHLPAVMWAAMIEFRGWLVAAGPVSNSTVAGRG